MSRHLQKHYVWQFPRERFIGGVRPDIVDLMGWLPNHRGAEGALVFPYTDETGGVLGLHFVFVTPTGEKSPSEPARRTRRGPTAASTRSR